ncbi:MULTISPECIES: heat shock protein transcriptional repressor HspR [unclassified Curtobacterium]|uniref:heat shock protein transcriptional repressor HspR n=1 Tax=unclassified Curtobacterium TaxID=257496 RepID=UPI000DA93DED|nr:MULTISPECIES: MerR family transcriptional regulator [unclassified Curtobacterium]PZE27961.1 transcriptional regulator [Curtobacterium sp. MCBD17_028]PZE78277.1 transcriptional regulator [Curtobacterium sp. MCBD17_019]PZF62438.1 transcriptional regulator [Curtobacterium sp. MCBD17_034]PZF63698.1 transcriptional regulator [Curtobacterium sp. MCBD17_013]PZM39856.1 transcriptional regulator [Curtobacterium sp. MCBD17_031]
MDEYSPVLAIAMAAELAGLHPQTLRQYDRLGLVVPQRTRGGSRRYSMRDVTQLREVARLGAEGVSLEGIRRVIDLENENTALRARVRELESALADELISRPGARIFAATMTGGAVPLRAGSRPERNTAVVLWRPRGD